MLRHVDTRVEFAGDRRRQASKIASKVDNGLNGESWNVQELLPRGSTMLLLARPSHESCIIVPSGSGTCVPNNGTVPMGLHKVASTLF